MSNDMYELIALGARYFFALLMLLIVLRAWRITIVDSRRAANLRRWSPETGVIGELQVIEGDEKVRRGMVYPVIREGLIGRSSKADVRLRSRSVRIRHEYFEYTPEGLLLHTAGTASLFTEGVRTRHTLLKDGDTLQVGKVRLLLVLNDGSAQSAEEAANDLFTPEESAPETVDTVTGGTVYTDMDGNVEDDYDRLLDGSDEADDRKADDAIYGEDEQSEKDGEEWWPRG